MSGSGQGLACWAQAHDAFGDAFVAVDARFRIVEVNAVAERWAKAPRADLVGRDLWHVVPNDVGGSARAACERALDERVPVTFDAHHDALDRWAEVHAVPTDGGLAVRARDVTELRRIERHHAAARSFQQHVIGIVGHDLRGPLTAITVPATRLVDTRPVPDPLRVKLASRIVSSARRMERLIGDLVDYTQASVEGVLPLLVRDADLSSICRLVHEEVSAVHPGRATLLPSEPKPCLGRWDGDRIEQALVNLLTNALRYGDPSQPVELAYAAHGDEVELTVKNGGQPIPPSELPHLFAPFRRAHGERAKGRLGLGLYIVEQVATAHGGTVEATSTAHGGTIFRMRLPRITPAPPEHSDDPEAT